MFIRQIIYNSQEVEIIHCVSTDEWINKMLYIHMMEYYLARNEGHQCKKEHCKKERSTPM